jgi:hypothetical protein
LKAQDLTQRFTAARVAERAVSVGSLYQYFPNEAATLFRHRRMAADDRVAAKGHRSNGCVVSSTLSFDRNAMKRQCVSRGKTPPLPFATYSRRRKQGRRASTPSKRSCGRRCPRPQKTKRALAGELIMRPSGRLESASQRRPGPPKGSKPMRGRYVLRLPEPLSTAGTNARADQGTLVSESKSRSFGVRILPQKNRRPWPIF